MDSGKQKNKFSSPSFIQQREIQTIGKLFDITIQRIPKVLCQKFTLET